MTTLSRNYADSISIDTEAKQQSTMLSNQQKQDNISANTETKSNVDIDTKDYENNYSSQLIGYQKVNLRSVITQELKFINTEFSETWDDQIMLHARVYAISQQVVSYDCIVDEESQLMERRSFPRTLFDNFANLIEGSLIVVDIKQKAGSMRVDIKNGKGIVDAQKFEIEHLIDSLKDF